jgi:TPR repeat protein
MEEILLISWVLKQALIGCLFLSVLTGFAFADSLSDAQRAYRAGNYQEAVKLFRLAAKNGSADARYALGSMYTYGEGVRIHMAKACLQTIKKLLNGTVWLQVKGTGMRNIP